MPQAVPASTTRRALITTSAALPLAVATGAQARSRSESDPSRKRRDFIASCGFPGGRYVATKAMAMGLDPDDCYQIQMYDRSGRPTPAIWFNIPGRPGVFIIVDPEAEYEVGRVR